MCLCNLQNFTSLPLYLSHTRAFIQTACASLPLPSVRVSTSSLWAPGQTLLFIFLSESNESHMHTRKCTLLHLHTRTNSPLLKTVNPSFYPHQVTTLVPHSPSFSSPFSLITLSVLAPPSRHSKAKRDGCQSKQATCIQTRAHLARLCSHDPYWFTNRTSRLCSCTHVLYAAEGMTLR